MSGESKILVGVKVTPNELQAMKEATKVDTSSQAVLSLARKGLEAMQPESADPLAK